MRFLLEIKAEVKNIVSMAPFGGVDDPNMPYFFKLSCEGCGVLTKEQCIYMSVYAYNHKGNRFNHVVKCKSCKRVGTVSFVPGFGAKYTAEDSKTFVPLMMFDCEGMVPKDYAFNGGWKITLGRNNAIEVNLVGGSFKGDELVYGSRQPTVENIEGKFTHKP